MVRVIASSSYEDHLNSRLLTRTTRGVSLTEAGRVFFDRCIEVVEAVERAEASVALEGGARTRGNLHVTTPLGLRRRVILLRRATAPCSRTAEGAPACPSARSEVAIRIGSSSFTLRKIADVRRLLCASPDYLAKRGAPAIPQIWRPMIACCCAFPARSNFAGPSIFMVRR